MLVDACVHRIDRVGAESVPYDLAIPHVFQARLGTSIAMITVPKIIVRTIIIHHCYHRPSPSPRPQVKISSGELQHKTGSLEHISAVMQAKEDALDALDLEEVSCNRILANAHRTLEELSAKRELLARSIERTEKLMKALEAQVRGAIVSLMMN